MGTVRSANARYGLAVLFGALVAAGGCSDSGDGGGNGGDPETVTYAATLEWEPSRHVTVGGEESGYRVYYSRDGDFEPGDSGVTVVDVPYNDALGEVPTSVDLGRIEEGTWYFRLQAYSPAGESELSPAERLAAEPL